MRTDANARDCTWRCMDTVRESTLKVDSGRKVPCHTRELNLLMVDQSGTLSTKLQPCKNWKSGQQCISKQGFWLLKFLFRPPLPVEERSAFLDKICFEKASFFKQEFHCTLILHYDCSFLRWCGWWSLLFTVPSANQQCQCGVWGQRYSRRERGSALCIKPHRCIHWNQNTTRTGQSVSYVVGSLCLHAC